ncbi:hypothetical protein N6B35_29710 (plasmid) [Klebsiella michiganensis]|uniref:hypothetical protein n=1 Tax=Klebsiella michiganensis TaxID=1134687 RepID=UPI0021DB252F|nr:hypothetical protein [Klebsiella michiganensis]UYB60078.1 hypothetical protein N6B35_29710 [Klebsiella michiganensis]
MTIDVNFINLVIVGVILRFVYVIGFSVARYKYFSGKAAIAESIRVEKELSSLKYLVERLFPKDYTEVSLLRIIMRNNINTLQDMKRVALILNDSKDEVQEMSKGIFEQISYTYGSALQVMSLVSQITVELEPLHKNGGQSLKNGR